MPRRADAPDRPLYGKGGIAVLAKEIIRLQEDLVQLVTGNREYFRSGPWGLTGPAGAVPMYVSPPADVPEEQQSMPASAPAWALFD